MDDVIKILVDLQVFIQWGTALLLATFWCSVALSYNKMKDNIPISFFELPGGVTATLPILAIGLVATAISNAQIIDFLNERLILNGAIMLAIMFVIHIFVRFYINAERDDTNDRVPRNRFFIGLHGVTQAFYLVGVISILSSLVVPTSWEG